MELPLRSATKTPPGIGVRPSAGGAREGLSDRIGMGAG